MFGDRGVFGRGGYEHDVGVEDDSDGVEDDSDGGASGSEEGGIVYESAAYVHDDGSYSAGGKLTLNGFETPAEQRDPNAYRFPARSLEQRRRDAMRFGVVLGGMGTATVRQALFKEVDIVRMLMGERDYGQVAASLERQSSLLCQLGQLQDAAATHSRAGTMACRGLDEQFEDKYGFAQRLWFEAAVLHYDLSLSGGRPGLENRKLCRKWFASAIRVAPQSNVGRRKQPADAKLDYFYKIATVLIRGKEDGSEVYTLFLQETKPGGVLEESNTYEKWKELAMSLSKSDMTEAAVHAFGRAAALADEGDREKDARFCDTLAGLDCIRIGQCGVALELLNKPLEYHQRVHNHEGIVQALSNIGYAWAAGGDVDRAIPIYREALDHAEAHGISHAAIAASARSNLSVAYQKVGRMEDAMELTKKVVLEAELRLQEAEGDEQGCVAEMKALGVAQSNLANLLFTNGSYEEALEVYDKALEIGREVEHSSGVGARLAGMGCVYEKLEKFHKAEECLLEAREIFRVMGSPETEGIDAALARVRKADDRQDAEGELAAAQEALDAQEAEQGNAGQWD